MGTFIHIWDGQNISAELSVDGSIIDRYIRGVGLIASDANGYYLYNAHGDVVQLTNSTGTVTKEYHYDAFGNEKTPDAEDTNPFRYCGEYFDKETGTIYLRARYYDPAIGRFISQDSYWGEDTDPLSINLYVYCTNSPIAYIDPSGHWQESDSQFSTTIQRELLILTVAWYMADDEEGRADIHNRANELREFASKGWGKVLDVTKSITGAAADEFAWLLGGDVGRAERDYWLYEAQKFNSNIKIEEKQTLQAIMFLAGIITPSPDDAWRYISKRASKEMLETVGEKGAKKFLKAITKFAAKQGDNGIIKLSGKGIKGFMYEAKVVGKEGAYRLLGNLNEAGEIIWEVFERTHH